MKFWIRVHVCELQVFFFLDMPINPKTLKIHTVKKGVPSLCFDCMKDWVPWQWLTKKCVIKYLQLVYGL